MNDHLSLVRQARKAYEEHRLKTAMEEDKTVLSFDYAESILLPIFKDTPSTFYFKTRRKVDTFGITDEKIVDNIGSIQCNFVVDECHRISKGPNSVISMIYSYLIKNVAPNSSIIFYGDNCSTQNKNQYLIGFFSYLVKTLKLYKEIEVYLMVAGHIKFSPDSHFGTIKGKLKRGECQSILQLLGSRDHQNICKE